MQSGDVDPFLQHDEVGSPAIVVTRLRNNLWQQHKKTYLKIEFAVVIDFGRPFVTATYNLEGDGALVLNSYEIFEEVKAVIQTGNTPNIDADIRERCTTMPQRQAQP